jgi:glycosyltransferase involved in cell wall biosynthesis
MSVAPPQPIEDLHVILIAPNVSEQRGGEAIKPLHIYLELERQGISVHLITHARVQKELDRSYPNLNVTYVVDTPLEVVLFHARIFEQLLNLIFMYAAIAKVKGMLRRTPNAIVHFTSPVSPILPYPYLPNAHVVIGPVNGNIHYPPTFRHLEPLSYKVRRWLHPAMQFIHSITFSGKRRANALLVAGGQRTYDSLLMAGCSSDRFTDSIDSGVLDRLYHAPRAVQIGRNLRFFHNGRLVAHKGTDLIIKSLLKTRNPVELDIIGRGPELPRLKALVKSLSLEARVKFIEWIPDHSKLAESLRQYRGFVFPSLAEANGIVVQEAMAQGIPVVALTWGGPCLLVTPETGILIEPLGEQYVIDELAKSLDHLAEDGALAESMSIRARQRAFEEGYLWPDVIRGWLEIYRKLLREKDYSTPV